MGIRRKQAKKKLAAKQPTWKFKNWCATQNSNL